VNINRHHEGTVSRVVAIALGIAVITSCSSSPDPVAAPTAGSVEVVDADDGAEPIEIDEVGFAPGSATYTIVAGDTLSGIADRAGTSLTALLDTNGWPEGSSHLILPGDVIGLPTGATAVTPAPSQQGAASASDPTSTADGSSDGPAGGYTHVDHPRVDSLGANGMTDPVLSPLPDGEYWSWDYARAGDGVSFTLVQYFVGDACFEQFGDWDECPSGNNTLSSPTAVVPLAGDARVSVVEMCCADNGLGYSSLAVSTSEFVRLVGGADPASDALAGYEFVPFGVKVTVRNGQAVAAEQIFTS